jgi:predicted phosphodiesterase
MTETETPHPLRHRIALLLLVAFIGGLAALLALRLVPPATHSLGPATVSARGEFGRGRTTVFIPPLGNISADTHTAPLGFVLTLTEIDPTALTETVSSGRSRQTLERDLTDDLRAAATLVALRLVLGAMLIGAIAAAVLPHRHLSTVVAGAAGGIVVVAVVLGMSAATFDPTAFREPRYQGALERAPQVIETLNRQVSALDNLRSRYETAADRLSDVLELAAKPNLDPREDTVSVLHVSDIHSNPIGVEVTDRLARQFGVDAVIDTGDVTSFGAPVEANIGDIIRQIPVDYLYVPGNHDSFLNRRAISRVDNVTLLDDATAEVGGVTVLGWGDPTFTASNETSTEEGNDARILDAPQVFSAVLRKRPDLLAVHDVRLAEIAIGEVPLVLAGHTHKRSIERRDGTLVMTVGSTGATGLGSFIVEADLTYEAQVIYFRDGAPVAYDYISLSGLGGDFNVERRTLEERV